MRTKSIGVALLAAAWLVGCGANLGPKTRDELREQIAQRQLQLEECYGAALKRDRDIAGGVPLALRVPSKGLKVDQVEVGPGGPGDAEMKTCMQKSLEGFEVSQAPKVNIRAEFTLNVQPTDDLAEGEETAGGEAPADGTAAEGDAAKESSTEPKP